MSAARDRWLNEGVEVLTEEGPAAVRIDRLAARLGLSKGSFHHHFDGADGFKKDLLDHVEDLMTDHLDIVLAAVTDEPGLRGSYAKFAALATAPENQEKRRTRLEMALRGWALTDSDAARTQARVDEARLAVHRALWQHFGADDEEARMGALLHYVMGLGATVIFPQVSTEDLGRLYERMLPLVPDGLPGDDAEPS